ncbi:MAG: GlsB/YeaQ/YmgE family stress response membrane protein [Acidobacteriota bacterium]
MGLLSWILMGLIAGVLARLVLKGAGGGLLVTLVTGIAGALLGGFLATQLGFGGLSGFDPRSLVIAMLGSILLLLVIRLLRS